MLILGLAFIVTTATALLTETPAKNSCRYKVWYLEPCDSAQHVQIVHLVLSKGGVNCEMAKRLTKVCVPSDKNAKPVVPEKAVFKDLLESDDYSKAKLEQALLKMVRESFIERVIL